MLKWSVLPVAAALALGSLEAAAAPTVTSALPVLATPAGDAVHQVDWRGRGGGFGRGLGVGLGIGVLGAIIANEAYRPRPGYYYDDYAYDGPYYEPADYAGDPRKLCAQNFRSFEWRTGLYTTYAGEKRLCPYLR
ncbi:MAG TPA: BA14K family protein [Hyphomicrobiaceae bacterium]|nr:BA14K family protein [Hyphomicrobiaceae bacterium]